VTTALLTGAAGFVGHHVLRHLLANTDWEIVCAVSYGHRGIYPRIELATAGLPDADDRVKLVCCDLSAGIDPVTAADMRRNEVEVILNVASESHVDRSLSMPVPFVSNNVNLMLSMLEFARECPELKVFVQVSTDEVYGPAYSASSREWDPILPSNPYSASKAAQEALAVAWWRSYGIPLILTNTMNLIGEAQHPEKFVPMVIRKVLRGEVVDIHASPPPVQVGSRFYLHARNQADALLFLARAAMTGEFNGHLVNREGLHYESGIRRPPRFNVVGQTELTNLALADMIRNAVMGQTVGWHTSGGEQVRSPDLWYRFVDFHSSRPGHDLRYALDGSKLATLGWTAPVPLIDSIQQTVRWTLAHPRWLET
jgi:dTDP-glucose 4,6-dehydratase